MSWYLCWQYLWFINITNLNITNYNNSSLETNQRIVFNGYYKGLTLSDIKINYSEYIKTRKHGYSYLGNKEN